ncbi:NUDIX domain-containing protein [Thalassiella azotivora]
MDVTDDAAGAGAERRVDCVGAVVHDARGRLLLVRRRNPPAAGTWSLPGGRVEDGEDDAAAVVREVAEETALVVEVGELVGTVERPGPDGVVLVIHDYACRVGDHTGRPRAGDDATDVRWVDAAALDALELAPLLRDALAGWGCLPRC